MHNNENSSTSSKKVVSLFKAKEAKQEEAAQEGAKQDASSKPSDSDIQAFFKQIMEANSKNQNRQKKDRNNANKSVLRSYRIKN